MAWGWFRKHAVREAGAKMRAEHSRWLSSAVRKPAKEYPRIPVREVEAGGFDGLMDRPMGRMLADAWWNAALNRVDQKRRGD